MARDGSVVKDGATLLRGKAVLLLFSSAWCPDCKPFCGIVKKFLAELRGSSGSGEIEVVWISSDRSAEEAKASVEAHHEWTMVPFNSPLRNKLKIRYGFCAGAEMERSVKRRKAGIPTLALVDSQGYLISTHAEPSMLQCCKKQMALQAFELPTGAPPAPRS